MFVTLTEKTETVNLLCFRCRFGSRELAFALFHGGLTLTVFFNLLPLQSFRGLTVGLIPGNQGGFLLGTLSLLMVPGEKT